MRQSLATPQRWDPVNQCTVSVAQQRIHMAETYPPSAVDSPTKDHSYYQALWLSGRWAEGLPP